LISPQLLNRESRSAARRVIQFDITATPEQGEQISSKVGFVRFDITTTLEQGEQISSKAGFLI
jgi:hypothetical protein